MVLRRPFPGIAGREERERPEQFNLRQLVAGLLSNTLTQHYFINYRLDIPRHDPNDDIEDEH